MSETYSLADVRKMTEEAGGVGETYSLAQVRQMASAQPAQRSQADNMHSTLSMLAPGGTVAAMLGPQGRSMMENAALGGVQGASDIGNTILRGAGWVADKLTGTDAGKRWNDDRRASLDEFFGQRIPEGDLAAGAGRIAANIAGTLGMGPALAVPMRMLAAAAPVAAPLLNTAATTVSSGGMSTGLNVARNAPLAARAGDMGVRIAGGAANGFASAGLVDPESAGLGAAVGALLPPGLQMVRAGTRGLGAAASAIRPAPGVSGADMRSARDIAAMTGIDPSDLRGMAQVRDALRQSGPGIIPGGATVPEILQNPGVSQLQRSVRAVQPAPFVARDAEREAGRREVLERIAPIGNRSEVAQEVGNSITEFAIPAERQAARRVSELFDSVPPDEAMMHLPLQAMDDARARFLGPGTFGKGAGLVDTAIDEANNIGMRRVPSLAPQEYSSSDAFARGRAAAGPQRMEAIPHPVPFDQIQKLRSSVGEAINAAERNGQNQARAALVNIKNAIDNRVAEVAGGVRQPGEVFTPQAIDTWGQALAEHAGKKQQFNTGPQAALFRRGGDGLPIAQGGEVPRRFFNANGSQVADAQSFRRLVQDDPRLMGELRRYAVSDAAGQADRFGNLTSSKFNKWLDARAGATGEIFTDQQRAWLRAIGDDLRRADVAESLGRSTGSDTAQKAASMMQLGLLDSPGARYAAGKIPGGGLLMDWMSNNARTAKAERFGGLLMEPERMAGLLDTFIATQQPRPQGLLGSAATPYLVRAAPGLLAGGGGR